MKILSSAHYLNFSYPYILNIEYRFIITIEFGNNITEIVFEKNSTFKTNSNQDQITLTIFNHNINTFIFEKGTHFNNSHDLNKFIKKEDLFTALKKDLVNSFSKWNECYQEYSNDFKIKYPDYSKLQSLEESIAINENFIKKTSILLDYISKISENNNNEDIENMNLLSLKPFLKLLNYIDINGSVINQTELIKIKQKI